MSSKKRSHSRSPHRRYRDRSRSSDSSSSYKRNHRKQSHKRHSHSDRKPEFKMSFVERESDILNHIKFQNLKISTAYHEPVMKQLGMKMQEFVGPVMHVSKVNNSNKHDSKLSISIGFKYDKDAMDYLAGRPGELEISMNNEIIVFDPTSTEAFRQFLPKLKQKQKLQEQKVHEHERISHQRKSIKKSRKYSTSRQRSRNKKQGRVTHRNKHRQRSKQRSRLRDRSHSSLSSNSVSSRNYLPKMATPSASRQQEIIRVNHPTMRKLFLFGVPQFFREKKIVDMLLDSRKGDLSPHEVTFRTFQNSTAQFVQIQLSADKVQCCLCKAQRLMQNRDRIRFDGFPLIVIDGSSAPPISIILQQLRQFQTVINFPERVHPSVVFNKLNDIGRIVQMIAQQKIVNGKCQAYLLTFSSSALAYDLINVGRTSPGISVSAPKLGQMVFRPTRTTLLVTPSAFKENVLSDKGKQPVNFR